MIQIKTDVGQLVFWPEKMKKRTLGSEDRRQVFCRFLKVKISFLLTS